MRSWTKWAVLALGLALAPMAQADEVGEVVEAVEAKYAKVDAIQAAFVQTTHSEVFGSEEQRGTLMLKRPRMMRWEFTSGVEKQFVTNGQTMWVYTRDENQVIKYDNVTNSGGADSLLQSLDKLDEVFKVSLIEDPEGHHLRLVPRGDEQRFKRLELRLDAELNVKHVHFVDAFEQVTELDFEDVKLNVQVPDSTFEFQVPDGVEVITTGGM